MGEKIMFSFYSLGRKKKLKSNSTLIMFAKRSSMFSFLLWHHYHWFIYVCLKDIQVYLLKLEARTTTTFNSIYVIRIYSYIWSNWITNNFYDQKCINKKFIEENKQTTTTIEWIEREKKNNKNWTIEKNKCISVINDEWAWISSAR